MHVVQLESWGLFPQIYKSGSISLSLAPTPMSNSRNDGQKSELEAFEAIAERFLALERPTERHNLPSSGCYQLLLASCL